MLRFVSVLSAFAVLTAALAAVLSVMALLRLPGRGKVSIRYSRAVCALLGVRITVVGTPPQHHAVLILANHVSWLDILAITATVPVIFVAKSEVRRWPLIGWVARARGTVFVERNRRQRTPEANADIAGYLAEGQSIVLFAEGTSSDGNRVLPFVTSLFAAAKPADGIEPPGAVVQTLSLVYTRLHGIPLDRADRPFVGWYGDMEMRSHAWRLLKAGPLDVRIRVGAPVPLAIAVPPEGSGAAKPRPAGEGAAKWV